MWGDTDGALEFLSRALQATPDFETGDVASILTKMANVQLATGQDRGGGKAGRGGAQRLSGLLRGARKSGAGAHRPASLARRPSSCLRSVTPARLAPKASMTLAEALERAGRSDEAKRVYAEFERQAHDEISHADNANRELVFYYTDHATNPVEALRIATLEAARRHDLYTLDAYAWALYANQDYAGARAQMDRVLAEGVRDAAIFFHAGAIAEQLNDRVAATRYLEGSLKLNPFSESAEAAREALAKLAPESATSRKPE